MNLSIKQNTWKTICLVSSENYRIPTTRAIKVTIQCYSGEDSQGFEAQNKTKETIQFYWA